VIERRRRLTFERQAERAPISVGDGDRLDFIYVARGALAAGFSAAFAACPEPDSDQDRVEAVRQLGLRVSPARPLCRSWFRPGSERYRVVNPKGPVKPRAREFGREWRPERGGVALSCDFLRTLRASP